MLETSIARKMNQGEFERGITNRQSRSNSALNKMEYNEKLERYKILIERVREYVLISLVNPSNRFGIY